MKSADASSILEDFSCFHVHETASTMLVARDYAQNIKQGVIYADSQTAGRGRLAGRTWYCNPGEGLLATFWSPCEYFKDCPPALVTGAVVLLALTKLIPPAKLEQHPLQLKWPNDILVKNSKLAGILCEKSGDTLFSGIGINLSQKSFAGTYRTPPTSVLLAYQHTIHQETMLTAVIESFAKLLANPHLWKSIAENHCAYKNEAITFKRGSDSGPHITGILKGIDDAGFLIIETEQETLHEASGELCINY